MLHFTTLIKYFKHIQPNYSIVKQRYQIITFKMKMMMKIFATLWLTLQTMFIFAQHNEVGSETNTGNTDRQIIVNTEMISRFNQVEAQDDIYSWRQLLANFDSQTLQVYFQIYHSSDMENQTLASIKNTLEKALEEHSSMFTDDYINQINQIKAEINQKIANSNQMLVSK